MALWDKINDGWEAATKRKQSAKIAGIRSFNRANRYAHTFITGAEVQNARKHFHCQILFIISKKYRTVSVFCETC